MVVPIVRRYTRAAPGALDVFALATEDVTGNNFELITRGVNILDVVSDPAPGAGVRYEIRILKGGNETPVKWFSSTLDPASAGRMAIGPVTVTPGKLSFTVAQRAGALAAYNFAVKYDRNIEG